jgi:hypothetical protein
MTIPLMKRHAVVDSFAELVARPLTDGINALCWPRTLDGDFGEVARLLAPADGVVTVDAHMLQALSLSPGGRVAADTMLEDLRRLDELGRDPVLNCIASYPRDERGLAIATDVMSFHADRAPVEVDTWLCTYWGKSSDILDNDSARRRIDEPAIRAALLQEYGGDDDGNDDDDFAEFIREGSFDLHYGVVDDAAPFACGVGNLWRMAVAWPGCPVPPCIHRAPQTMPGDEPRLLIIC